MVVINEVALLLNIKYSYFIFTTITMVLGQDTPPRWGVLGVLGVLGAWVGGVKGEGVCHVSYVGEILRKNSAI